MGVRALRQLSVMGPSGYDQRSEFSSWLCYPHGRAHPEPGSSPKQRGGHNSALASSEGLRDHRTPHTEMLFAKWPLLYKGRMACTHILEGEAEAVDKKMCATTCVCMCPSIYVIACAWCVTMCAHMNVCVCACVHMCVCEYV